MGILKVDVKIDYREKKRSKQAEEYYSSQGHTVSVERLDTGDYVFEDKVAFEYKTYDDMFKSINDGRIFDESLRQREEYPYHFVIIVGSDKDRHKASYKLFKLKSKFSIKQYYGAVARLNTYTNVIYAPNIPKAFKIMECQAEKSLDEKPLIRELNKKTDNPALNILMFLPNVKYNRAELITKELGLSTVEDLFNITYDDLISINGIGDKIASNILDNLTSKYKKE